MIVKASDIKFLFVPKDCMRKKKCGCIELKVKIVGHDVWIQDVDGLCKKHRLEGSKELKRQHRQAIEMSTKKRTKKK